MEAMLNKCNNLKEINGINIFNINYVINIKGMFQACKELDFLDLFNFNTSKFTDIQSMFNDCHKLKEIKGINKFDTSNVTNMCAMFGTCKKLEYLDLSNFYTYICC